MKQGLTEVVFILDMSGSMASLSSDTIGGFNTMIEQQKAGQGEALISTVLFNSRSILLHDRVNVCHVGPITKRDYQPMGSTALLDAVGSAIDHISLVHKYARPEDVPEHTLFAITTDGMENSSRSYDLCKVKSLISDRQQKCGWEFLFLGANIDAAATAADMGIDRSHAAQYVCDAEGTALNYETLSDTILCMRASAPIRDDWKSKIEADSKKRGKGDRHGNAL